jgi:hypothetical protein
MLFIVVGWMISEAIGVWLRVRSIGSEVERTSDRIAELERGIARREELLSDVRVGSTTSPTTSSERSS